MRRYFFSSLFGLAVIVGAVGLPMGHGQALAQEKDRDWNGFYGGGNLGGAFGGSDFLSTLGSGLPFFEGQVYPGPAGINSGVPGVIAAYRSNTADSASFTGGLQVGYNYWANNILIGIEADANFMRIRNSAKTSAAGNVLGVPPEATTYSFRNELDADYLVTIRPRIGVPVGSGILYATGGLAITTLKFSHTLRTSGGVFSSLSEDAAASETKFGWTVGAGYELPISQKMTIKAEYLFAEFDNITSKNNLIQGTLPGANVNVPCGVEASPGFPRHCFNHEADLLLHMLRLGINYQF